MRSRAMRIGLIQSFPLALVLVLCVGPALGTGFAPQILDPANDAYARAWAPVVGLPHPAIDLRSVTFARAGLDVVSMTIAVEDVGNTRVPLENHYRVFTIDFSPGTHDRMTVALRELNPGDLSARIVCWDGGLSTCTRNIEDPVIDVSAGTITVQVPLDDVEYFHAPNANSGLYPKPLPRPADLRPNFGFQDFAPDHGAGSDFDP